MAKPNNMHFYLEEPLRMAKPNNMQVKGLEILTSSRSLAGVHERTDSVIRSARGLWRVSLKLHSRSQSTKHIWSAVRPT